MKKVLLFLLFCSLSHLLLASPRGKTLYKCTFTLSNNQKISGWFEVAGYEKFCFQESNSKYLNNKGMKEVLDYLKDTKEITLYKRLYFPKFAKSENKQGYLKGQFVCCLNSDVANVEISKVKDITYINTLKKFDAAWMDITTVNDEMLNLLENQKSISEYTTGEALESYTFLNYNPSISKKKLKELAEKYINTLQQNMFKAVGVEVLNKDKATLTAEYLENKIVIVYAYGPC